MEILAFQHAEHEAEIRKWLFGHEKNPKLADELPEFGFIAFDEETGEFLAAGFLRRLEMSSQVLLDSFIANPKTFGKRRHFALNAVFGALLTKARELEFAQILGNTLDGSTRKRAERWGFHKLPHTLMALDLGDA